MKLFVATDKGEESDDFTFTVPGELVHLPPVTCDCRGCGCDQAMCGLASHKASTAFTVRDVDIDLAGFTDLLWESLEVGGWVDAQREGDREWVESWAKEHTLMAVALPPEAPLRVKNGRILIRGAIRPGV